MHKPALRRWLAPCIGECISHCRPIEHQGAVHGVGVRLCAILFVLTECAHRWLQVPLNRIYDRGICHDSCTGLRIRDSTDASVEGRLRIAVAVIAQLARQFSRSQISRYQRAHFWLQFADEPWMTWLAIVHDDELLTVNLEIR